MSSLSEESLQNINGGGGFWEQLGEAFGNYTGLSSGYQRALDARCRYEYGISYKEYCKLVGIH